MVGEIFRKLIRKFFGRNYSVHNYKNLEWQSFGNGNLSKELLGLVGWNNAIPLI